MNLGGRALSFLSIEGSLRHGKGVENGQRFRHAVLAPGLKLEQHFTYSQVLFLPGAAGLSMLGRPRQDFTASAHHVCAAIFGACEIAGRFI